MRVQLCQINPCVGDLVGNLQLIETEIAFAVQEKCDLVVFPELSTTGYPPRDFLYRQEFWDAHDRLITKLSRYIKSIGRHITVIVGGLHQVEETYGRRARYNAAFIIDPQKIKVVHKRLLPCYDVFDETRYFRSGINEPYMPISISVNANRGECQVQIDVIICEDMWNHKHSADALWLPSTYTVDPIAHLTGDGPIIIINASPFWEGKFAETKRIVEDICVSTSRPVCWVNQIGAHDDIIMGGYSIVSTPDKKISSALLETVESRIGKFFTQDRIIVQLSDLVTFHDNLFPTFPVQVDALRNSIPRLFGKIVNNKYIDAWYDYMALKLHLVDYCRRTGFADVVLGLSGGIDSAVVAAIAAGALGAKCVHGVTMPSKFSSEGSVSDAEKLATNLNIASIEQIPIEGIHEAVKNSVLYGGRQKFENSVTDENIQPRCRMIILMALSNDNGWLLLTTGNKSELAMGYCTLYGDMSGGLAVISDIPKTRVYAIARMLNEYSDHEIIPQNTIDKPPSAELKEDQADIDTLPEYNVLDPILEQIMMDCSRDEIVENLGILKVADVPISLTGLNQIIEQVRRSEFKRRQLPDGPKLRQRSFGSGRRMPVAAKYTLVP